MASSLPWVTNDTNPDQTLTVGQGDARYIRSFLTRTIVTNANYTVLATDRYVALMGPVTAPRSWALPLASQFPPGIPLYLVNDGGGVSVAFTWTFLRQGADTVNGAISAQCSVSFGGNVFFSDGVSNWTQIFIPAGLADPGSNGLVFRSSLNQTIIATTNVDFVKDVITGVADASYTALATDRLIGFALTLTAPRVVTLPLASAVPAGVKIFLIDIAGGVTAVNTVSLARAGSNLINGSASNFVALANAFAGAYVISDGSQAWTVVRTGQNSVSDPGSNGIMTRTSFGVTGHAVLADILLTIGSVAQGTFLIGPTAGAGNMTNRLLAYADFVTASLIGTAINTIAAGNDSRFTNSRQCNNGFDTPNTARVNLVVATQNIAAAAIDWSTGDSFSKSLVANTTFTFANSVDGEVITVLLTNGASWTVAWPTVKWPAGAVPVMTTGAGKIDVYTFKNIGGTIYGTFAQNMS